MPKPLAGVFAAAVTPLQADLAPALDALPLLLDYLEGLGCHGALLLGTTGEGPSFSVAERNAIVEAAVDWRRRRGSAAFRLLAGTGCASLTDTIEATRAAHNMGVDATVILPAFYYKGVDDSGLVEYFRRVADEAVPADGRFLAYHIPRVAGVPVPMSIIDPLRAACRRRFAGLKDSGVDVAHTRALCRDFPDLTIFTGTDSHLTETLAAGGAGSITALANVSGGLLRTVYDGYRKGLPVDALQANLAAQREVLDDYPAVAAVKALLADHVGLPLWPVRPPLQPLTPDAWKLLTTRMHGQQQGR